MQFFIECSNFGNYKSYEFRDASYTSATITDMVAHYWPDISDGSYGLIRYANNSNSWISTYIKISDVAGEITINGISAGYRPQRGVLVSGSWTWDNYILSADINNNTSRRMATGSVIDGANFHQLRLQAEPTSGGYQLSAYDNDTGSRIGSVSIK